MTTKSPHALLTDLHELNRLLKRMVRLYAESYTEAYDSSGGGKDPTAATALSKSKQRHASALERVNRQVQAMQTEARAMSALLESAWKGMDPFPTHFVCWHCQEDTKRLHPTELGKLCTACAKYVWRTNCLPTPEVLTDRDVRHNR